MHPIDTRQLFNVVTDTAASAHSTTSRHQHHLVTAGMSPCPASPRVRRTPKKEINMAINSPRLGLAIYDTTGFTYVGRDPAPRPIPPLDYGARCGRFQRPITPPPGP